MIHCATIRFQKSPIKMLVNFNCTYEVKPSILPRGIIKTRS